MYCIPFHLLRAILLWVASGGFSIFALYYLHMTKYFIIPGLGNSGPEHWQTWLEQTGSNFQRIWQSEWDAPECKNWIARIDQALSDEDLSQVVLIGHSLGVMTIVQWAITYKRSIKGAFLVAPSDPEDPKYTFPAIGYSPVPLQKLPFRSIVVTSSNDPWVSLERARFFADQWGSECVNIGEAGHINADSGHGPWPEGLDLLNQL